MKKHIEWRHPAKYVELFGGGKKRTPATSGGSSRTGDASGLGVTKTPAISPASKTPAQPCLYYENARYRKFTKTPAV